MEMPQCFTMTATLEIHRMFGNNARAMKVGPQHCSLGSPQPPLGLSGGPCPGLYHGSKWLFPVNRIRQGRDSQPPHFLNACEWTSI